MKPLNLINLFFILFISCNSEINELLPSENLVENSLPEIPIDSLEEDSTTLLNIMILVFDPEIKDFVATDASVEIYSTEEVLFSGEVDHNNGFITIPDTCQYYEVTVRKSGFNDLNYIFSNDSITYYFGNCPLKVLLTSNEFFFSEYYGLGFIGDELIFGGINAQGSTQFISLINGETFYGGWSLYIPDRKQFVFGTIQNNKDYIIFLNCQTGEAVKAFQMKDLLAYGLVYSQKHARLFGVGMPRDSILFGYVNANGEEQILSSFDGYTGISALSIYDEINEVYYFGVQAGYDEFLIGVNVNNGSQVRSFLTDTLNRETLAFSASEGKFFGLGSVGETLVFGSLEMDGSETIISRLEGITSYLGGWKIIDENRRQYIFGISKWIDGQGNKEEVVVLDIGTGKSVRTFVSDPLYLASLAKVQHEILP